MFVGYVTDHAGDTYKMLNLRTKRIWRSRDIKWIATSITQLESICAQDAKPPADNDDDDDAVEQYIRATGVNLIPPDDDNEAAQAPAAPDEDIDDHDDEDSEEPPSAVASPPATSKTLRAMCQLSTFYNPDATAYLVDHHSVSSDDTKTTSNQLGREAATTISDEAEGDLDGDLYQDHPVASAAIDYLPNFAFYTRNQVLTPSINEVQTLNVEDAFQHHLIEPTTFNEVYNHEDPKQRAKWREAIRKEF